MASLYKRKRSPYFWIKYKDERGEIHQESTGFKFNIGPDVRRAKQLEAEKHLAELKRDEAPGGEHSWAWAAEWLNARYHSSPLTLERYLCAWANVLMFLAERKIESPQQFQRQHCYEYVNWRQKPDKGNGKYAAKYNTALMELKPLRIVLQEAVERHIIPGNPAFKLGLKKEKAKVKPELTAQDCETIRKAIEAYPDQARREMLTNSFEIARNQGCRLSETRLNPMTDVDLVAGTIVFHTKGSREHLTALHPALVPLFTRLKSEARTSTWNIPKGRGRQWASTTWWKFLDSLGLTAKGISFHCTRVTVATELARNDVPESKAMRYLGHASTTVHRIYQRLVPEDVQGCTDAISSGKPRSSSKRDVPSST